MVRAVFTREATCFRMIEAQRTRNNGRRHQDSCERRYFTQLTKKRMWRASSCITGSNTFTSAGGKNPDSRARAKRPKAKKESKQSPKQANRTSLSSERGGKGGGDSTGMR